MVTIGVNRSITHTAQSTKFRNNVAGSDCLLDRSDRVESRWEKEAHLTATAQMNSKFRSSPRHEFVQNAVLKIPRRFIVEWIIISNFLYSAECLLRLSIFRFFCLAVCCLALGSARFAIKTKFCNSSAFATRGETFLRQERQQRQCHMIAWSHQRGMIFLSWVIHLQFLAPVY
jgi:hypothetical protein